MTIIITLTTIIDAVKCYLFSDVRIQIYSIWRTLARRVNVFKENLTQTLLFLWVRVNCLCQNLTQTLLFCGFVSSFLSSHAVRESKPPFQRETNLQQWTAKVC